MRWSTLVLVLGVAALVFQGCAGKPKAPPKDVNAIFNSFDLSRDGRISRNEFLAQIKDRETGEKLFNAIDANGDGYISREEAEAKSSLMQEALRLTAPPPLR